MKYEIYTRPLNTYKHQVSNSHEHFPSSIRMSINEDIFNGLESKYDLWQQLDSISTVDESMGYGIMKYENAWIRNSNSLRAIIAKLDDILEKGKHSNHLDDVITDLKITCETALKDNLWVVFDF